MQQHLKALLNATQTISSSSKIEDILENLTKEIRTIVNQIDAIFIFLFDKNSNTLVLHNTYGITRSDAPELHIAPGEGIAGTVFRSKELMLLTTQQDVIPTMRSMNPESLNSYLASLDIPMYPESVICVPMLYQDECLGVITVDRFIPDLPYTEEEAKVLESIARLASVSIAYSSMYQQLRQAHEQLNYSIAINKALAMTSMHGRGLDSFCENLSDLLDTHVVIYNEFLEPLSCNAGFKEQLSLFTSDLQNYLLSDDILTSSAKPFPCLIDDRNVYIAPINGDAFSFGYYAVYTGYSPDHFNLIRSVNEISILLLAVELMRIEREHQIKENMIGESLNSLLEGHPDSQILLQLQKKSPNISHGRHILVLMDFTFAKESYSDSNTHYSMQRLQKNLIHQITLHSPRPIYMLKNRQIIALYTFPSSVPHQKIDSTIENLYKKILEGFPSGPVRLLISCSQIEDNFEELPRSMQDTELGIQYLRTTARKMSLIFFHQLGVRKMFIRQNRKDLENFCQELLGPLWKYDEEHHSDLVLTMKTYKQNQRSAKQTIQDLNIHKNTLIYRLKKIRELMGYEQLPAHEWFDVEMALEIKDYLDETET